MDTPFDFNKALLGTKNKRRFFIPGTELEVELRLLSTKDMIDVETDGKAYLGARGMGSDDFCCQIEENVQLIARSAHRPDTNDKLFKTAAEVREVPLEFINHMADQYLVLSRSCNPALTNVTEEDLDELKKKLLSGEDLSGLSYFQLASLTVYLADYISILEPPAKSSSTEQDQTTSPSTSGQSTTASTLTSSTTSPASESQTANEVASAPLSTEIPTENTSLRTETSSEAHTLPRI